MSVGDLAVEMLANNLGYLLTPKGLAPHGPEVQKKPPRAKAHVVSAVLTPSQAAKPPSISKLAPVTMPDSGPAR